MITEIIDLLVDTSNAFGSLCSYLRMKYKNFGTIINEQAPINMDKVEQLYVAFPKLRAEIDVYQQQAFYVVVDSYSVKNRNVTLSIAVLDKKYKVIHVFSMLQKNAIVCDLSTPCYWEI